MDKLKAEYISKMKQVVLAESGLNIDDLSRYEKYLSDSDNEDELKEQAQALMLDIGGRKDGQSGKVKLFKL